MTTLSIPAAIDSRAVPAPRGYAPAAAPAWDAAPKLLSGGAALLAFAAVAFASGESTGIAAVLTGVAAIITAVGAILSAQRKHDAGVIETLVKGLVEKELDRLHGPGPVEPDSAEAQPEPEKPHRERKRRPPKSDA